MSSLPLACLLLQLQTSAARGGQQAAAPHCSAARAAACSAAQLLPAQGTQEPATFWPHPFRHISFEEFEKLHVWLSNISQSFRHFDADRGGAWPPLLPGCTLPGCSFFLAARFLAALSHSARPPFFAAAAA